MKLGPRLSSSSAASMSRYALRARSDDNRLRRDSGFIVNRCSTLLRRKPDFLIIGEMKCGTSSLFTYLRRHPEFRPPVRKETHYFSVGYDKGDNWYRAHFPLQRDSGWLTGEACPDYLFTPHAAARIRAALPDAKLIVLLRDPAERAISHYYHEVRMGREHLPLETALAVEDDRLARADPRTASGLETYLHASYRRRGCYSRSLKRYFDLFPREQILVIGSGHLFESPGSALNRVLGFLGLTEVPEQQPFEVKNRGTNKAQVPMKIRDDLNRFFKPHNRRLYSLLGEEIYW